MEEQAAFRRHAHTHARRDHRRDHTAQQDNRASAQAERFFVACFLHKAEHNLDEHEYKGRQRRQRSHHIRQNAKREIFAASRTACERCRFQRQEPSEYVRCVHSRVSRRHETATRAPSLSKQNGQEPDLFRVARFHVCVVAADRCEQDNEHRRRHKGQRRKPDCNTVLTFVRRTRLSFFFVDNFRFAVFQFHRFFFAFRLFEFERERRFLTAQAEYEEHENTDYGQSRRCVNRHRYCCEQARKKYVHTAFRHFLRRNTTRKETVHKVQAGNERARHEHHRGGHFTHRRQHAAERKYRREYEGRFVALRDFAHQQRSEHEQQAGRQEYGQTERKRAYAEHRDGRQEERRAQEIIMCVEIIFRVAQYGVTAFHRQRGRKIVRLFSRERVLKTLIERERILRVAYAEQIVLLIFHAVGHVRLDRELFTLLVQTYHFVDVHTYGRSDGDVRIALIRVRDQGCPVKVRAFHLYNGRTAIDVADIHFAQLFPVRAARRRVAARIRIVLHGDGGIPRFRAVHRADVYVNIVQLFAAFARNVEVRGLILFEIERVARGLRRAERGDTRHEINRDENDQRPGVRRDLFDLFEKFSHNKSFGIFSFFSVIRKVNGKNKKIPSLYIPVLHYKANERKSKPN